MQLFQKVNYNEYFDLSQDTKQILFEKYYDLVESHSCDRDQW